jgi:hypothetical protein
MGIKTFTHKYGCCQVNKNKNKSFQATCPPWLKRYEKGRKVGEGRVQKCAEKSRESSVSAVVHTSMNEGTLGQA